MSTPILEAQERLMKHLRTAQMLPHELSYDDEDNTPEPESAQDDSYETVSEEESGVEDELRLSVDPTRDMILKIDGDDLVVDGIEAGGHLVELTTEGGNAYYIAPDSETAGAAAREVWYSMMSDDPSEFTELVGVERVMAWGLGQPDNFGFTSANDFLDAIASAPEEEFAGYDGEEREASISEAIANRLNEFTPRNGWADCVAYRAS